MKVAATVIGAFIGFWWTQYHNAHISIWTGGYYIKPFGVFLCVALGAAIGLGIATLIQHELRKKDETRNS